MEPRVIRITQNDLNHLRDAIHEAQNSGYRHSIHINQLKKELERAEIVHPQAMPPDVITMNSTAVLVDLENQERMQLTLRYPQDARAENQVSILAPIGCAMLGYRVGDEFEWQTPAGMVLMRVEQVIYQPEAVGVYD